MKKAEKKANNANGKKLEKPFAKTVTQQAATPKMEAIPQEQPPKVEAPEARAEQGTAQVATPEQAAPPKVLTFEEMQVLLNSEIERLNKKTALTRKRKTFVECLESLALYTEKLEEEAEFETTSGKISFQFMGKEAYNNRIDYDDSFSITNTALIHEFAALLSDKVKIKIMELEAEILKP